MIIEYLGNNVNEFTFASGKTIYLTNDELKELQETRLEIDTETGKLDDGN